MSLPIALLHKSRIDVRRKIAIGGLFSLTFFTMAVSIARAAVVIKSSGKPDDSLLTLWSKMELTVAIIIACLVSYRAWFTRKTRSPKMSGNTYVPYRGAGAESAGMSQPLGSMKTGATVTVHASSSLDADLDDGDVVPLRPVAKECV